MTFSGGRSVAFLGILFLSSSALAASKWVHASVCSSLLLGAISAHLFPPTPKFPAPHELRIDAPDAGKPAERARWIQETYHSPPGQFASAAFAPVVTLGDASGFAYLGAKPGTAFNLSVTKNFPHLLTYAAGISFLIFLRRALSAISGKDFLLLANQHLKPPTSVLYLSSVGKQSPLNGVPESNFKARYGVSAQLGEAQFLTFNDINDFRDRLDELPQLRQFDRIELIVESASASGLVLAGGTKVGLADLEYLSERSDLNITAPGAELIIWADNASAQPAAGRDGASPNSVATYLGKWLLKKGGKVVACPRKLKLFEPILPDSFHAYQRRLDRILDAGVIVGFCGLGLGVALELKQTLSDLFSQNFVQALSEITILDIDPRRDPGDDEEPKLDAGPGPIHGVVWCRPRELNPRPKFHADIPVLAP